MDEVQEDNRVKRVLILVAMTHEGLGMISALGLSPLPPNTLPLPLQGYSRKYTKPESTVEGEVLLVINGQRKVYNLDGTLRILPTGVPVTVEGASVVPAAIAAWEAIRYFKPSLVISAGTAGGVKHKAIKGKVYVSNAPVVYHDRLIDFRLPGDEFNPNNYQAYGVGSFPVLTCPKLISALGLCGARVSSGASFDPCTGNILAQFNTNNAGVKEMEAAAVAEVAQLLNVPFIAIKGITDYVEHGEPTGEDLAWNEQFAIELGPISDVLAGEMVKVIQFVMGKKLSDL